MKATKDLDKALARKDLDGENSACFASLGCEFTRYMANSKTLLSKSSSREDLDEKSKAAIRKAIERKRPQSGGTNKPDAR